MSIKKALKYFLEPAAQFLRRKSLRFNKIYEFRKRFGRFPNFLKPKTFTERLYLKMAFDRDPKLTLFTDKHLVRGFIVGRCGSRILTKLYATIDNAKEIRSLNLPDRFVMKPNHLSGAIKIVKDFKKESLDELEKLGNEWLKTNYYYHQYEWAYKNIKPLIIFEELLEFNNDIPDDYKFYCFNGKSQFIEVHRGRFTKHFCNIYDTNLSLLPIKGPVDNFEDKGAPLSNFNEMREIAEQLSRGTDFVRVDLYNIDGRIVFGELTVYPGNGVLSFNESPWDEQFGKYWK